MIDMIKADWNQQGLDDLQYLYVKTTMRKFQKSMRPEVANYSLQNKTSSSLSEYFKIQLHPRDPSN